jgi:hypothetical protein
MTTSRSVTLELAPAAGATGAGSALLGPAWETSLARDSCSLSVLSCATSSLSCCSSSSIATAETTLTNSKWRPDFTNWQKGKKETKDMLPLRLHHCLNTPPLNPTKAKRERKKTNSN